MNLRATHCFVLALTLLGCNSSDTPSDIIKEEPKLIVEDVKSNPCHEYFDSNSNLTHNALYFNYREGLQWLDDKQSVLTYLKSEISDVKSDEYGLTAYIEGNSKWLKFEFSTGKFSKVRERHNNKSRQPPFAEYFVADLVNRLGHQTMLAFIIKNVNCYGWTTEQKYKQTGGYLSGILKYIISLPMTCPHWMRTCNEKFGITMEVLNLLLDLRVQG